MIGVEMIMMDNAAEAPQLMLALLTEIHTRIGAVTSNLKRLPASPPLGVSTFASTRSVHLQDHILMEHRLTAASGAAKQRPPRMRGLGREYAAGAEIKQIGQLCAAKRLALVDRSFGDRCEPHYPGRTPEPDTSPPWAPRITCEVMPRRVAIAPGRTWNDGPFWCVLPSRYAPRPLKV